MSSAARRWGATRNAPTLLLAPRPDRGLSPRQLALIRRFASRLGLTGYHRVAGHVAPMI
jgi:hypothetical protein